MATLSFVKSVALRSGACWTCIKPRVDTQTASAPISAQRNHLPLLRVLLSVLLPFSCCCDACSVLAIGQTRRVDSGSVLDLLVWTCPTLAGGSAVHHEYSMCTVVANGRALQTQRALPVGFIGAAGTGKTRAGLSGFELPNLLQDRLRRQI